MVLSKSILPRGNNMTGMTGMTGMSGMGGYGGNESVIGGSVLSKIVGNTGMAGMAGNRGYGGTPMPQRNMYSSDLRRITNLGPLPKQMDISKYHVRREDDEYSNN